MNNTVPVRFSLKLSEPMLTVQTPFDASPNDVCVTEWQRINIVEMIADEPTLFTVLDWLERNVSSGDYRFEPLKVGERDPDHEEAFQAAQRQYPTGPIPAFIWNRPNARFGGAPITPPRIVWEGASDEDAVLTKLRWEGRTE